MASSWLPAFRQQHPDDFIAFQTLYPDAVQNKQAINKLVINIEEQTAYDKVYDLRMAVEPTAIPGGKLSYTDYMTKNRIDVFGECLGIPLEYSPIFNLKVDVENRTYWLNRDKKIIVFSPFSIAYARSFNLRGTLDLLFSLARNHHVVLLGEVPLKAWGVTPEILKFTKDLQALLPHTNITNLLGETTLAQAMGIIRSADLCISVDTGALHIAGVLDIPQLGLFGNITPRLRTKYYYNTHDIMVQDPNLPCQPCGDFAQIISEVTDCLDQKKGGTLISAPCMRAIPVDRIYNAATELLKNGN